MFEFSGYICHSSNEGADALIRNELNMPQTINTITSPDRLVT